VTRHPNAIAIDGDITKPLGCIDLIRLPPIGKFVHAAADTSLHHACGAKVLAANQAGTPNTDRSSVDALPPGIRSRPGEVVQEELT
jgi:hypothetical protein